MNFEPFLSVLSEQIKNRFEVSENDSRSEEFMNIGADYLFDKKVLRLLRSNKKLDITVYCKTMLMVDIRREELRDSFEWGALVKEMLLDPETADLYLLIFWKAEVKPSLEECLKIESSEDICRKFVFRPHETIESFIERTFLKEVEAPQPLDLGQDPLISAFSGLEEQFGWFSEAEKARWKEAFGSGASGSDLFDELIIHKSKNNETP
ncbi:MAG: hypothetical protein H7069_11670 [Phormidesmis sp. FL-bin-119]|nr:hypothetical protein [Pedobacter sp.]